MEIISLLITLGILLYSAILHEIAHGYVAYRFGDPTAKLRGRLTLNPLRHLDLYFSLLLPLALFLAHLPIIGGAKPVPIDPYNLRDGRRDIALVSLAGPLTNILLAVLSALIIHLVFPQVSLDILESTNIAGFILVTILRLNLLLAIFNLIPIPPLDGSKIFALILPERDADAYLSIGTSIGIFLIFFLLMFPIGGFSLMSIVSKLLSLTLTFLGF